MDFFKTPELLILALPSELSFSSIIQSCIFLTTISLLISRFQNKKRSIPSFNRIMNAFYCLFILLGLYSRSSWLHSIFNSEWTSVVVEEGFLMATIILIIQIKVYECRSYPEIIIISYFFRRVTFTLIEVNINT